MELLGRDIAPLGLGCWPLAVAFFEGARPLGHTNADPNEALRTIRAGLDCGIGLSETAAVYGADRRDRGDPVAAGHESADRRLR